MKTKEEAEIKAKKILNYYCEAANTLTEQADKLSCKDRPKNIQSRLNRLNKIDTLTKQAVKLFKKGHKAWAYYINNYHGKVGNVVINPIFKM